MSDSWVMDPTLPLGMIDKLRRQVDDQSPEAALAGARRRGASEAIASCGELVADDEANSAMLEAGLQSGHRVLPDARGRQGRRGARDAGGQAAVRRAGPAVGAAGGCTIPSTCSCCSRRSSTTVLRRTVRLGGAAGRAGRDPRRPGHPDPALHRCPRRADPADLVVAAPLRPRDRRGRAAAATRWPASACRPASARGRARVVFDLSEIADIEPGDIIVCSTTDPSWVPLFLIAGGVVCDVGAAGEPRRDRQPRTGRPVRGVRARRPVAHPGRWHARDRRKGRNGPGHRRLTVG